MRPLRPDDREEWWRMRCALWPAAARDEPVRDLDRCLSPGNAVFVSPRRGGGLQGFLEVSIRNCAEGCETDRVGYIEGWYVDADRRRLGIGRALVAVAEGWARDQGCTEMASDAELANTLSHDVHARLGYAEQARIVCFRKALEEVT